MLTNNGEQILVGGNSEKDIVVILQIDWNSQWIILELNEAAANQLICDVCDQLLAMNKSKIEQNS